MYREAGRIRCSGVALRWLEFCLGAAVFRPLLLIVFILALLPAGRVEGLPITFSNATALAIPDNSFVSSAIATPAGTWTLTLADDAFGDTGTLSGGWSLVLDVVGSVVTDLNVTLFGLSHTFFPDLDIRLTGPVGTFRDLTSDNGAGAKAINATLTFDDEAALNLTSPLAFSGTPLAVISGSYKTEVGTPLSLYDGLAYQDSTPVPEPSSLLLLGGGIALLAFKGHQRRQARQSAETQSGIIGG